MMKLFNRKAREKESIEAEAIILNIDTGLLSNDKLPVRLQVQVNPDKGRSFVTEIDKLFSNEELAAVRTGMTIKVRYNPNNYRQLLMLTATTTLCFFSCLIMP